MMPTVSVIIPTFNRSRLLERTIRSVLSQTYRDFEIIIVDDASTDNTQEMLNEKFKQEIDIGIIRYVRNEINLERSRSRNKGMDLAAGNYIALLDDDDTWLPDHLNKLVCFMEANEDVGGVFSKAILIYDDGIVEVRFQELESGKGDIYRNICMEGGMALNLTALFKKEVYRKLGGYKEDILSGEDREFFSRIAMNYNVGYLKDITCCYYRHKGSYTKKDPEAHAYATERIWQMIVQNSIKYNYYLTNELVGKICLNIAKDFIPNMHKTKEYLYQALKTDFKILAKLNTWGLMFRAALGRNLYLKLYNFKQGLKLKHE